MSENSFIIRHHNLLAEIDAHTFGNRKFIMAQIQAGFWGDVQAAAKKLAVKLLKETWNLPTQAKDKACVKELTKQIVNSLTEHLEHQEETTHSIDLFKNKQRWENKKVQVTSTNYGSELLQPNSASGKCTSC